MQSQSYFYLLIRVSFELIVVRIVSIECFEKTEQPITKLTTCNNNNKHVLQNLLMKLTVRPGKQFSLEIS